jgi:hypothetical protein
VFDANNALDIIVVVDINNALYIVVVNIAFDLSLIGFDLCRVCNLNRR